MGTDSDTMSGWFVLKAGFKVHGRCPDCHSPNISFYKERITGMKGISPSSKGLTPVCLECGKNLPQPKKRSERLHQRKTVIRTRF